MKSDKELFRLVATIGHTYRDDAAELAAEQILDWANEGLDKSLPQHAWDLRPFKHYSKGNSVLCVRLVDGDRYIWALCDERVDDSGARSVCSTEFVIERLAGERTNLTVRQVADGYSRYGGLPLRKPSILSRINDSLGLYTLWDRFSDEPWVVTSKEQCWDLISLLEDSTRKWPVYVLTVPEESADYLEPILDPVPLARATMGLARVVVLPHDFTWELTNRFGKERSVYRGAVRCYLPGFNERADLFRHKLILPRSMEDSRGRQSVTEDLQRIAAAESLEQLHLGIDVLEFFQIRKRANELERRGRPTSQEEPPAESLADSVPLEEPATPPAAETSRLPIAPVPAPTEPQQASDLEAEPTPPALKSAPAEPDSASVHTRTQSVAGSVPATEPREQILLGLAERVRAAVRVVLSGRFDGPSAIQDLNAANARITALESSLKEAEKYSKWFSDEHSKAENRANQTDVELADANARISELEDQLRILKPDDERALPHSWSEFGEWCERALMGKVMLSPRAEREVKKPKCKEIEVAAKGLLWLATEYREQRLAGGAGDLRGPNDTGLLNEPCGGTQFKMLWNGKQVDVKWHLKNGGNTHDPTRCLRVYYFWDPINEQVVIASMPAHHRVTGR